MRTKESAIRKYCKQKKKWKQQKVGFTTGNKERIFVSNYYIDQRSEEPTTQDKYFFAKQLILPLKKNLFQVKLFLALEHAWLHGFTDTFAWLSHGRAFKIYDREMFESKILPRFFGMKNYSSFARQCSIYKFRRLTNGSGPESSRAYYHEFFLRDKPFLCARMSRLKIKGTNTRPAADYLTEPKFFDMPHCHKSLGVDRLFNMYVDIAARKDISFFESKPFRLLENMKGRSTETECSQRAESSNERKVLLTRSFECEDNSRMFGDVDHEQNSMIVVREMLNSQIMKIDHSRSFKDSDDLDDSSYIHTFECDDSHFYDNVDNMSSVLAFGGKRFTILDDDADTYEADRPQIDEEYETLVFEEKRFAMADDDEDFQTL